MKSLKKIVVLFVFAFGMSSPLLAQYGLSVRLNAGFLGMIFDAEDATDEYGYEDPMSIWDNFKFAAGLKYQHSLVGNLDLFASADIFYKDMTSNPPKGIAKLRDDEIMPSNLNAPVMLGLNYTLLGAGESASLWVEAGAGFNFRSISSRIPVIASRPGSTGVVVSDHVGATIAWKASVGFTIDEEYSLELTYCTFGSSEVKGNIFAKDGGIIVDWARKFGDSFMGSKYNPSMLFLCLGYHF